MTWYAYGSGTKKTASDWHHGTTADFDRFDFDKDREEQYGPKHWNSHLGSHFTSEHETAANLAAFGGSGSGHVYHVDLAMKNPKHYPSEHDLDREAYNHARRAGYFTGEPRVEHVGGQEDALRNHPQVKKIAESLKNSLGKRGHDGITYGNQYEGSHNHTCAIAFHPDDITITGRHGGTDECGHDKICPECYKHHSTGAADCDACGHDFDSGETDHDRDDLKLTRASSLIQHFRTDISGTLVPGGTHGQRTAGSQDGGRARPDHEDPLHRGPHPGDGQGRHADLRVDRHPSGRPGPHHAGRGDRTAPTPLLIMASRDVSWHSKAKKDLKGLDKGVQKQVNAKIDAIARGDEGLQTHALAGKLKGWDSTKVSRGHRVIHQTRDDGGLHIGYVGLHEYGDAKQRLGSAPTKRHITDDGEEYQMRYSTRDEGERKPRHVIEVHHEDDGKVGEMNWYGTTGTLHHIGIDNDSHLRKGLATAMWNWSQEIPGAKKPKHSADRTTQGDAWAKSVGGPRPRKKSSLDSMLMQHFAADSDEPEHEDIHRDREGNCVFYPQHEHEHEDAEDGEAEKRCPYEDTHTDWDEEYPRVADTLHRGMRLNLSALDHRTLHDPAVPKETKAKTLTQHLRGTLGTHWTDDKDQAQHYSQVGSHFHRDDPHDAQVMVHVHKPEREWIEEDPENLHEQGVLGRDYHDDAEIPLQHRAPVKVKGISWLKNDPHSQSNSHLDESWEHHDFGDEHTPHTAVLEMSKDQAREHAKTLLAKGGHPAADRVQVLTGNVGHSSATHWDDMPSILLNHGHLTPHVVAHEVSHLLLQHRNGADESGHGDDFHQVYREITGKDHGPYNPDEGGDPQGKTAAKWSDQDREILDRWGTYREERDEPHLQGLIDKHGRPSDRTLYRGVAVSDRNNYFDPDKHQIGDTLHLPVSSFSEDHGTAEEFAHDQQLDDYKSVMFHLHGGQGLPVDSAIQRGQKEWISSGRYKIVGKESNPEREIDHVFHLVPHHGHTAAKDALPTGHRENWEPGSQAHFEYHCLESHDSDDAQAWYHSHRPVTVQQRHRQQEKDNGVDDLSFSERIDEGAPASYTVRHGDGFEHTAFEDELYVHPKHFYRPDPPQDPTRKTAAKADPNDRYTTCEQGHTHWGAEGAAGLLVRHTDAQGDKHYLLQHRGQGVDHPNTWSIPGGAIQKGESPHAAAYREAEEEMGDLPEMKHRRTLADDHGKWGYHTVVVDAEHMFTPKGGGTHGHEQQGAAWHHEDEIEDLPLHPGFKKTWGLNRTAAKQHLIHRGVYVSMNPEEVQEAHEQGGREAVHRMIADKALQGPEEGREHRLLADRAVGESKEHAGLHWTDTPERAERHADPMTLHEDPNKHSSYGWDWQVPVTLHGTVGKEHVETDPEALAIGRVHGYGQSGAHSADENETMLRPGAKVNVHEIRARLPKGDLGQLMDRHGAMGDGDNLKGHEHTWETIHEQPRTVTAAKTAIRVYRSEARGTDEELSAPDSVGVHWTTRPTHFPWGFTPEKQQGVVWHADVSDDQIADRTDRYNEGEVVLRPGSRVRLQGRTTRTKGPGDIDVRETPEHPMDHEVEIRGTQIKPRHAGYGEKVRALDEMKRHEHGYGTGWDESELNRPHRFMLRHLPLSELHSELSDRQMDNPHDNYNNPELREKVRRGNAGAATVTRQNGRYVTLDGHHRIMMAAEEGQTHLPVWVHDKGLTSTAKKDAEPSQNPWASEYASDRKPYTLGQTDNPQFHEDYRMTSIGPTPKHFGHDTHWEIGGGAGPMALEMQGEGTVNPLRPEAPLRSTQTAWDAKKVDRMRTEDPEKLNAGGEPEAFLDNGVYTILDGHHRLLADRMEGRPTDVRIYTHDDYKPGHGMTALRVTARDQWMHVGDHPDQYDGSRWLHAGTTSAASQRSAHYPDKGMYRLHIAPQNPANSEKNPVSDWDANRIAQWQAQGGHRDDDGKPTLNEIFNSRDRQDLQESVDKIGFDPDKHDAIYYHNNVEDPGSVSVMASPNTVREVQQIHGGQPELPFGKSALLRHFAARDDLLFKHEDRSDVHRLHAYTPESADKGQPVGYLTWRKDTGEIDNIIVPTEHQRQGIGTQMIQHARGLGVEPKPQHSTTRTKEGEAWSHAVDPGHGVPWEKEGSALMRHFAAEDYWGGHQAPEPDEGSALHDPHNVLPDVHEHPEYYSHYEPKVNQQAINALHKTRGKPDAKVPVYRSVPHGVTDINKGDWVSTSADYARQHGMQSQEGHDWPVLKAHVRAGDLHGEGEITEWGYHGDSVKNADVHHPGGAAGREHYESTRPGYWKRKADEGAAIYQSHAVSLPEHARKVADDPNASRGDVVDAVHKHLKRSPLPVHDTWRTSIADAEDAVNPEEGQHVVTVRRALNHRQVDPHQSRSDLVTLKPGSRLSGSRLDVLNPQTGQRRGGETRTKMNHRVANYDPMGEQDWDEVYHDVPDEVHRGVGVNLPDDLHRFVHDDSKPKHERAKALVRHLQSAGSREHPHFRDDRQGLGTSWSGDEGVSEDFSKDNADNHVDADHKERSREDHSWGTNEEGERAPKPATAVMLHAHKPERDEIDDDPNGDGSGMRYTFHGHGENEVPVHGGTPMRLKGVSWREHYHMEHPKWMDDKEEFTRHDFDEPLHAEAAKEPNEDQTQHEELLREHVEQHHPDLHESHGHLPARTLDTMHRSEHTLTDGAGFGSGNRLDTSGHEHHELIDPTRPYRDRVGLLGKHAKYEPPPVPQFKSLDDLELRHQEVPSTGGGRVSAWADGGRVGELAWNGKGKIVWVNTYEDEHKRRGVATHMLNHARTLHPNIHHSEEMSESGAGWAKATPQPGDRKPLARTTSARVLASRAQRSGYRIEGPVPE